MFISKDKYEKMKDNLQSENEEYLMALVAKQRMKLWDSVVWNQTYKKIK